METITGYVDHIIYRNADNGYTVLVLVCEEEEITCVGIFSGISEGENVEVTGEYTAHPTYGKQFKAESYAEKEPTDELSIERYLGSGAIKGIGAALAARIVRRFKGDTFRIIEEEPERLAICSDTENTADTNKEKASELTVSVETIEQFETAAGFTGIARIYVEDTLWDGQNADRMKQIIRIARENGTAEAERL